MGMAKYLIDTTLLVDHLRGDLRSYSFLKQNRPAISHVTVAELVQGTSSKVSLKFVDQAIKDLETIPISESISSQALKFQKNFFHSHNLQLLDALIAATAIENKLTLVTANTKHFSFIKRLKLLDWKKLRKS